MISYINETDNYILIALSGSVTTSELLKIKEKYENIFLTKGFILDCIHASIGIETIKEVYALAQKLKPISQKRAKFKNAFVGYFEEELLLLKTFKTIAEHSDYKTEIQIFTSMDKAKEWMNES